MKTAIITTVFNEEKSIESFLESLITQTKMPTEIIIVDANSKDATFEILKIYKKKFLKKIPKVNFQVFQKNGNRSVGRNIAIKKTTSEIIAVTDAGCILKKDWFEKITFPFQKKNIDVVAGFYKPLFSNIFEKALSTYTCVMEERLDNNFLPSSRSIAFKKGAWKKIGGYPEDLDTCEDLVFARNLKRKEFKFYIQKNAIIFWQQKKNIWQAFKQFFNYAKGDGQAFYIRKSTPFLFLRYLLGIILLFVFLKTQDRYLLLIICYLLFFYIIWSINKNYKFVNSWAAFVYLPLLQFTSDIAVILGMSFGLLKRIF